MVELIRHLTEDALVEDVSLALVQHGLDSFVGELVVGDLTATNEKLFRLVPVVSLKDLICTDLNVVFIDLLSSNTGSVDIFITFILSKGGYLADTSQNDPVTRMPHGEANYFSNVYKRLKKMSA